MFVRVTKNKKGDAYYHLVDLYNILEIKSLQKSTVKLGRAQ